jgi:hypothetical protein
MSELDFLRVAVDKAGPVPAALVVIAVCGLLFWVLWGRLSKGVVKDAAEVDTYKMLVEDNKRLSGLVESLGEEIRQMRAAHAKDIEAMQRSLFEERDSCFRRMSELKRKVENLERRLGGRAGGSGYKKERGV